MGPVFGSKWASQCPESTVPTIVHASEMWYPIFSSLELLFHCYFEPITRRRVEFPLYGRIGNEQNFPPTFNAQTKARSRWWLDLVAMIFCTTSPPLFWTLFKGYVHFTEREEKVKNEGIITPPVPRSIHSRPGCPSHTPRVWETIPFWPTRANFEFRR